MLSSMHGMFRCHHHSGGLPRCQDLIGRQEAAPEAVGRKDREAC